MNYEPRIPETNKRWQSVERLFLLALDFSDAELEDQLRTACNGDDTLFSEVLKLLQAHAKTDGLLDALPADQAASLIEILEDIPDHIGPYAILRELGEGGMGRVFHARRTDGQFEREVAIKVLRPGLATKTTVQRFLHERQVLARLQHPGIARLLDGNIDAQGHPYFAMDYVEGQTITAYCDAQKLGIEDRLQLFLDVCDAVQYAHRNLVVHRDLKPANILVNTDGDVKLLDFGIARVLDSQPAEVRTVTGLTALTPEYASPEQVNGKPITTASDIYSLGVTLHEMLVGSRPYEIQSRSLEHIVRAVCEQEPEVMSVTLGRLPDEDIQIINKNRGLDASGLHKSLKGDLDVIVEKALQKEVENRYASIEALAEDIRRHLTGKPILAQGDSSWYRTKKYAARHKAGVMIAVVILLSTGTQIISQYRQAIRVATERDIAKREAVKAEQIGAYLESIFANSDPEVNRGAEITARELLDAGAARVERELSDQSEVQAHLLHVLGRVYSKLKLDDRAVEILRKSLAQYEALYGAKDTLLALVHYDLGFTLERTPQFLEEAANHYKKALSIQYEQLGANHDHTLNSSIALSLLGHQLHAAVLPDSLLEETLKTLVVDTMRIASMRPARQIDVAQLYLHKNEVELAASIYQRLIAALDSNITDDRIWLAQAHKHLGNLYVVSKKPAESVAHLERARAILTSLYGEDHPSLTTIMSNIADGYSTLDNFEAAIRIQEQALEQIQARLGEQHPDAGIAKLHLARSNFRDRRYEESITWYRGALSIFEQNGEKSTFIPVVARELGMALMRTNRFQEAEQELRNALAVGIRELGKENPITGHIQQSLAELLLKTKELPEAIAILSDLLPKREAQYGLSHVYTAVTHLLLGEALAMISDYEKAAVHLEQSLTVFNKRETPQDSSWAARAQSSMNALP